MNSKLVLAVSVLLFFISINIASAVMIYVQPANQGIVRLNVTPFRTTTETRSFEIRNMNNFSISVTLQPNQNITDIIDVEKFFDLQQNESRLVNYTIKVSEPGTYDGNVLISFNSPEGYVSYESNLDVIATEVELDYMSFLPFVLIAVVAVAGIVFVVFKKRKAKK